MLWLLADGLHVLHHGLHVLDVHAGRRRAPGQLLRRPLLDDVQDVRQLAIRARAAAARLAEQLRAVVLALQGAHRAAGAWVLALLDVQLVPEQGAGGGAWRGRRE